MALRIEIYYQMLGGGGGDIKLGKQFTLATDNSCTLLYNLIACGRDSETSVCCH